MARIRPKQRGRACEVRIEGPLSASDLRRLEQACGRTLEQPVPPLVILLDSSPSDAPAQAYLDRLRERGAVIQHRTQRRE
jgi:hypothetical protein